MKFIKWSIATLIAIIGVSNIVMGVSAQVGANSKFHLFDSDQDKRLSRNVSIQAASLSLSEALSKIGTQTGVTISTEELDTISDVKLVLSISGVSGREALNGILSLISYKNSRAFIDSTKKDGKLQYIVRLKECHNAQSILTKLGDEAFRNQYEMLLKLSNMSNDKRKGYRKEFEKAMFLPEGRHLDSYFEGSDVAEKYWKRWKLLLELTTESERTRILSGSPLFFDVQGLSMEMINEIFDTLSIPRLMGAKGEEKSVDLQEFGFFLQRKLSGRTGLCPSLRISETHVGREFSGRSRSDSDLAGLGSWELAPLIRKKWVLPGDSESSPLEKTPVPENRKLSHEVEILEDGDPLHEYAARSFAVSKVQFMAILPTHKYMTAPDRPKTVGGGLTDFIQPVWLVMSKWRGNLLLLNYADWFYGDETLCSTAQIAWLKKAVDKDGLMSLDNLSLAVTNLTEQQREGLKREFPMLAMPDVMLSYLKLYASNPQIASKSGISLDPEITDYLKNDASNSKLFAATPAKWIRIRESRELSTQHKEPIFVCTVEMKRENEDWKTGLTIRQFKGPDSKKIKEILEQSPPN